MDISEHEQTWLTSAGAEMMASLGISSGDSAVDFGCGIGRYTIPLSQAVGPTGQVFAIERDTDNIQALKMRMSSFPTQGEITVVESTDIPFASIPDHTIDVVLAFDVLQHIADWPSFFHAVKRVLKRSGILHIYPAAVPHPDAVDGQALAETVGKSGFHLQSKATFAMMHNKHIVTDTVHTFHL